MENNFYPGLPDYRITGLPDYQITGLPDYQITGLPIAGWLPVVFIG